MPADLLRPASSLDSGPSIPLGGPWIQAGASTDVVKCSLLNGSGTRTITLTLVTSSTSPPNYNQPAAAQPEQTPAPGQYVQGAADGYGQYNGQSPAGQNGAAEGSNGGQANGAVGQAGDEGGDGQAAAENGAQAADGAGVNADGGETANDGGTGQVAGAGAQGTAGSGNGVSPTQDSSGSGAGGGENGSGASSSGTSGSDGSGVAGANGSGTTGSNGSNGNGANGNGANGSSGSSGANGSNGSGANGSGQGGTGAGSGGSIVNPFASTSGPFASTSGGSGGSASSASPSGNLQGAPQTLASQLSAGQIAGIVIGSILAAAVIAFLIVCVALRRRKRTARDRMGFHDSWEDIGYAAAPVMAERRPPRSRPGSGWTMEAEPGMDSDETDMLAPVDEASLFYLAPSRQDAADETTGLLPPGEGVWLNGGRGSQGPLSGAPRDRARDTFGMLGVAGRSSTDEGRSSSDGSDHDETATFLHRDSRRVASTGTDPMEYGSSYSHTHASRRSISEGSAFLSAFGGSRTSSWQRPDDSSSGSSETRRRRRLAVTDE